MQEEVNQKTVALSIRTTKLTGKVLAAALGKVARALQKHHRKALTPQGRQSVKKLMNHYPASADCVCRNQSFFTDRGIICYVLYCHDDGIYLFHHRKKQYGSAVWYFTGS